MDNKAVPYAVPLAQVRVEASFFHLGRFCVSLVIAFVFFFCGAFASDSGTPQAMKTSQTLLLAALLALLWGIFGGWWMLLLSVASFLWGAILVVKVPLVLSDAYAIFALLLATVLIAAQLGLVGHFRHHFVRLDNHAANDAAFSDLEA